MKDYPADFFKLYRPVESALNCIDFCLESFDSDQEHRMEDEVVPHCTYEEVIGALLKAKDELRTCYKY